MAEGLVLDSGALIAVERGDRRMDVLAEELSSGDLDLDVPAVVVAEVWRGGSRAAGMARYLDHCEVITINQPLARAAGELLAAAGGNATIDAIVVAIAALRRKPVLTGDRADLAPLASLVDVELIAL